MWGHLLTGLGQELSLLQIILADYWLLSQGPRLEGTPPVGHLQHLRPHCRPPAGKQSRSGAAGNMSAPSRQEHGAPDKPGGAAGARQSMRAEQRRACLRVGVVRLLGVSPGEQWLSPLSQKQKCKTRVLLESGPASRPSRWLAAIWSLLYTTPHNPKSGHFRG